jgi:transcriptional regulator with PAS, ATPase and Fis domain
MAVIFNEGESPTVVEPTDVSLRGDLVVASGSITNEGAAQAALADPIAFADDVAADVLPIFAAGLDSAAFEELFAARRLLVAHRHREAALRVDFALIEGALETDDHTSARSWLTGALAAAREFGHHTLLAHGHVASVFAWRRNAFDRPIAPFGEGVDLPPELRRDVFLADALLAGGDDPRRAVLMLTELLDLEPRPLRQTRVLGELARLAGRTGDGSAEAHFQAAIAIAVDHGFRRVEGRIRLDLAWHYVSSDDGNAALREASAAHTALGAHGSPGDRVLLGRVFRRTGRRFADRALSDGSVRALETTERVQGSVQGALIAMRAVAERAIAGIASRGAGANADPEEVSLVAARAHEELQQLQRGRGADAIEELHRATRDLAHELVKVEEQAAKLRLLLERIPRLEQSAGPEHATEALCALGLEILDADLAVVVIEQGPGLEVLAQKGRSGQLSERWRPHVGAELTGIGTVRRPSSAPRGDSGVGAHLVVPIYAGDRIGSFYADRQTRGGQFVELDERLGSLLGDYISLVLSRSVAHKAERRLHRQLEATFDAIRQGILSVSGDGAILAANADALRILRLPARDVVGRKLSTFHDLRDLEAALPVTRRLDGVVVKIGSVNAVVTARPFDDGSDSGGLLLSFVEFERAQTLARRISAIRPRYTFDDCVGESRSMRQAVQLGRQASLVDATVLITGESGTGKEVLAQAIHGASTRASAPFVGINCAALPRDLLEAELFGYEKGAFTGAKAEGNAGKFELAGDGTILLDEIGDMPLDMQAKLLRVLQERSVQRLGGNRERPVNARVIATTHQDLEAHVAEGKFRLDLLFRLRVLAIELPALRDRRDDILPLCLFYLQRFAEQQGKHVHGIGPELSGELYAYDWPGNIREVANVMESEVSRLSPDMRTLSQLTVRLLGNSPISLMIQSRRSAATTVWSSGSSAPLSGPGTAPPGSLPPESLVRPGVIEPLVVVEKRAFMQAYDLCAGNVAKAATALGVSKVTFYAKLKQWGILVASRGRTATDEAIEREVQRRLDERLRALEGPRAPELTDDEMFDPPTPRTLR